jgi:hypothetical protein
LRKRQHYGTTGTRLYLSVNGSFDRPVACYDDDPALGAASQRQARDVTMGAIVASGDASMSLAVDVIGAAPLDRVDIFHGKEIVRTVRPYSATDLGRRIRVLWSGAEYRGRGREVTWIGKAVLDGNRIERVTPVNFLNPDRPFSVSRETGIISWQSVTTGNMAGFDLWLEREGTGMLSIESNIVTTRCNLATLDQGEHVVEAGGLARQLRIYRLPEQSRATSMHITHEVSRKGVAGDLPIYVRVTQEDGHQAWSSPIYLIDAP